MSFADFFSLWLSKRRRKAVRPTVQRSCVPTTELLEDRLAPAGLKFIWDPNLRLPKADQTKWSISTNWLLDGKRSVNATPGDLDTVEFAAGANDPSTDDIAANKLKVLTALTIDKGYTATITLDTSLSVQGGAMAGGVITGANLTIAAGTKGGGTGTFTWSAGVMAGDPDKMSTLNVGHGATLVISATTTNEALTRGSVALRNRDLKTALGDPNAEPLPGTVSFVSGTLDLIGSASIQNAGIFNVKLNPKNSGGIYTAPDIAGNIGRFVNEIGGTLSVAVDPTLKDQAYQYAFYMAVPFQDNGSNIEVKSGYLRLSRGGSLRSQVKLGTQTDSTTTRGAIGFTTPNAPTKNYAYVWGDGTGFSGNGAVFITGVATASKPGGQLDQRFDAQVTVRGTVQLPNTVQLSTVGGELRGGTISLSVPNNTGADKPVAYLDNTILTDGFTLLVGSGAKAILGQNDKVFPPSNKEFLGQLKNGATIKVDGGTLEVSANTTLIVDRNPKTKIILTAPTAAAGQTQQLGKLVLNGDQANILSTSDTIDKKTPVQLFITKFGQVLKPASTGTSEVFLVPELGAPATNVKVEGKSTVTIGTSKFDGPDVVGGSGRLFGPASEGVASLNIDANGGIDGTLTVTVGTINNAGTLAPAFAGRNGIGTLTFQGNLTDKDSAALDITIGGPDAGTQYDQIIVNGQITLAGTLNITAPLNVLGNYFTLIVNQSGAEIIDGFSNAPDGSEVMVGNRLFTISYEGNGENDVVLTAVNPIYIPTTNDLVPSANPTVLGQPVTLTDTVSTASGTPTGTVTFFANGISLGTAPLVGDVATLTTTALPAGTDVLTATYSGDVNFASSTSDPVNEQVFAPLIATGVPINAVEGINTGLVTVATFQDPNGASTLPVTIGDPSFEAVNVGTGTYYSFQYAPTGLGLDVQLRPWRLWLGRRGQRQRLHQRQSRRSGRHPGWLFARRRQQYQSGVHRSGGRSVRHQLLFCAARELATRWCADH